MTDPLAVTPDELRATAERLADVSSRMNHVLSTLVGALNEEGPAWGNDNTGRTFAEGPDGYLSQLEWVKSSITAKTSLLDEYSRTLRTAANTLEEQDDQ